MNNKRLRESDYFVAWLLFFLAATIGGGVVGFIFGAIIGVILGISGVTDPNVLATAGGIIGFIVGIPVSYLSFRFFVGKFIVDKVR
ncbi:MAG: hypothetical protein AAFX95_11010 [Cyanobacteria bacterium J06639_16]